MFSVDQRVARATVSVMLISRTAGASTAATRRKLSESLEKRRKVSGFSRNLKLEFKMAEILGVLRT